MKKKNLFCALLSALLALALLAGCAAPASSDPTPDPAPETTQPEQTPVEPEAPAGPAAPVATNSDSYTEVVYGETESGPIIGFTYRGVNTFRGVPYATAERFKAPVKPEPWTEPLPCFNWGKVSYSRPNGPTEIKFTEFMTPSDNSWVQGEDCQNLNLWTPSMDSDAKLPVLLFLQGGDGNAQELVYYDGNSLAGSGDVVFVTANHREQMLGCLDLSAYGEEYADSAYLEYLDIFAALQWIQDNIENFGGDPDNVTLMGQSAGAYNVMRILCMPSADGLYHKVVMNSSPHVMDQITTTREETQAQGAAVVEALGLTAETIDQIGEIPYADLLEAGLSVGIRSGDMPLSDFYLGTPFTVDGEIESNRQVPMMISDTYAELTDNFAGIIRGGDYSEVHHSEVTADKVTEMLQARYGENAGKVLEMYNAAYPGRDPFYALYIQLSRGNGGIYDVAKLRVANGGAPVYTAVYSYCIPLFGGTVPIHTNGDLPFIFNNVDTIPEHIAGDEEMAHKVAAEASTALANFMRTGNPNGEGVPEWPAYDAENGTTMFFDRTSEARSGNTEQEMLNFMSENRVDQ